ncbi:hypothetical protein QD712_13625 [Streptomyces acidiscabies]|uniref:hypothetical protein n=1 Tax=Streptomyces acidiscabies TaxID=42234 RepID=UPI0030D2DDDA
MLRHRRLATLASAAAVVALSATLLTGCEWDDASDCLSTADTTNHEKDWDGSKADKAVDDLNRAIQDYNRDILDGDSPDSTEIDRAAERLKDVCTN